MLREALVARLELRKLEVREPLVDKMMQLWHHLGYTMGAILLGPPGAGKTTCHRILFETLGQLNQDEVSMSGKTFPMIESVTINPKAISVGNLYGEYDEVSRQWNDGLLSFFVRLWLERLPSQSRDGAMHAWIIFDGHVDMKWVESLNSALDDNRLLCLANAERIRLSHALNMLFEVENLDHVSPATVSRCSVVYIPDTVVTWRSLMHQWLAIFPDQLKALKTQLEDLLEDFFEPAVELLRACELLVPITDMCLIEATLTMIDSVFFMPAEEEAEGSQAAGSHGPSSIIKRASLFSQSFVGDADSIYKPFGRVKVAVDLSDWRVNHRTVVERTFVFCLAWSVFGMLDQRGREVHLIPTNACDDL